MSFIGNYPAGKYSVDRPVEWILSGCMLCWGGSTLLVPAAVERAYLGSLGIPWAVFVVVTLVFGAIWVYALIWNGEALPWTARARWFCSVVCCLTLAGMAVLTNDILAIGSHAMWALGALYSCLRAGIDATGETSYRSIVNVAIITDNSDGARHTDIAGSIDTISDVTVISSRHGDGGNSDGAITVVESGGVRKAEG